MHYQITCYRAVPLRILSRLWGWIMNKQLPASVRPWLYNHYASTFGCNLEEAAHEDLKAYKSLAEFFCRPLKDGVRPINEVDCIVSNFFSFSSLCIWDTESACDIYTTRNKCCSPSSLTFHKVIPLWVWGILSLQYGLNCILNSIFPLLFIFIPLLVEIGTWMFSQYGDWLWDWTAKGSEFEPF